MSKDEMAARLLARAAEALAGHALGRRMSEASSARDVRMPAPARRGPAASVLSVGPCRRARCGCRRPGRAPVELRAGRPRARCQPASRSNCRQGYEAQIRPRSGLALKHGVTLLNSPGTIDADYRGEVKVILINLGDEPFVIRRGDRIAQLVIARVAMLEIVAVERARRHGARAKAASAQPADPAGQTVSSAMRQRDCWQRRRWHKFSHAHP